MSGPSNHLSWAELACKDGTPYPQEFRDDFRVLLLAACFEDVRALWGKPITILSAYRTPSWNSKIGGARNSQHLYGRALDLAPPEGVSIYEFYQNIYNNTDNFGIKGLGKYLTFVHIDVRPTDRLYTWSGTGVKDSGDNG